MKTLLAITSWLDKQIANYAHLFIALAEKVKSTSNYRMSRTIFIGNQPIPDAVVLESFTFLVANLLQYAGFPAAKIAPLAGVSIPFVKEIKAGLRM